MLTKLEVNSQGASIADSDPLLDSAFAKEMLRQMKALDTYDMYEKWTPARILAPFVLTKEQRMQIPVIGDPDDVTMSRIKAYYNAISALIEQKTGLMAVPMINLTHEGFGRAVITVGKLIVMDKTLRDVHRFSFKSLTEMHDEAQKLVDKAAELMTKYSEVAGL